MALDESRLMSVALGHGPVETKKSRRTAGRSKVKGRSRPMSEPQNAWMMDDHDDMGMDDDEDMGLDYGHDGHDPDHDMDDDTSRSGDTDRDMDRMDMDHMDKDMDEHGEMGPEATEEQLESAHEAIAALRAGDAEMLVHAIMAIVGR